MGWGKPGCAIIDSTRPSRGKRMMVINGSEVGKTGSLEDEYMMRDQPNDDGTK
jgi:hypothetical protein